MEEMKNYFRNGYRRLKRLIAWLPIIWKDEDWDPKHLFEVMRFKISRIRKEMESNKRHSRWQEDVRDMKIAEDLLSRLGSSDFYYDLSKKLENEEKEGRCSCPEETFSFEPLRDGFSKMVDLRCSYCKKAAKRWYKRDDSKQKEDMDYLFGHLRKKVMNWWD